MEFRDFATQETSALLARLLSQRSGTSLQQLNALREALEAAVRTMEASPAADRETQDLVARLTQAADTEVQRVREEARAAKETADRDLEALRCELDGAKKENHSLGISLSALEADLGHLRGELQTERERAEAAEGDLAATVEAHAEVEAALRQAEAAGRHETQAKTALEGQLHTLEGQLQKETRELGAQLEELTGTNAVLREELESLRSAQLDLEASRQMMEAAARKETQARTTAEEELLEARGLLDIALAESTDLRGQLEGLTSGLAEAKGELAATRHELSAIQDQLTSVRNELASAHHSHEQLEHAYRTSEEARIAESQSRAALAEELERAEQQRRDLEQQRHDAEAQRQDTERHHLDAEQHRQNLERELADARGLLDMSLAETAQLKSQIEAHTTEMASLQTELTAARDLRTTHDGLAADLGAKLNDALEARERLSEQLAGQEREKSGVRTEVGALRGEMDRMVSLLDASVRAVDDLAAATTVAEIFATLVERLSIQFSRVALFRLKGNRLEGEHQFGFDDSTDVTKLILPLTLDSIVSRVASSASIERLSGSEVADRSGMPFGSGAASALALPIVLQGETLAVIYADYTPWNQDDSPATPESSAADEASLGFAKLLVAQTGVLLMRHTHEIKMLTELRDYAAMLLQEAELMYAADAEAGKSKKELRKRLKDNLDCASQLYAHRAALEGTAAAGLLDEQIAAAIAGSSAFAHDLAAVAGQLAALDPQVTAEAS